MLEYFVVAAIRLIPCLEARERKAETERQRDSSHPHLPPRYGIDADAGALPALGDIDVMGCDGM